METEIASSLVMPNDGRRLSVLERFKVGVEIVATYCRTRWWLTRLDFPAVVELARDTGAEVPHRYPDEAARLAGLRLGAAVVRTLRSLPVDGRCLVTALVLTRMLARRGISTTFVLGVRAQPRFAAHAWIELGGVALLPTSGEFQPLRKV